MLSKYWLFSARMLSKTIYDNYFAVIIAGPIGLVNLMTAKACGASKVAITGECNCYF